MHWFKADSDAAAVIVGVVFGNYPLRIYTRCQGDIPFTETRWQFKEVGTGQRGARCAAAQANGVGRVAIDRCQRHRLPTLLRLQLGAYLRFALVGAGIEADKGALVLDQPHTMVEILDRLGHFQIFGDQIIDHNWRCAIVDAQEGRGRRCQIIGFGRPLPAAVDDKEQTVAAIPTATIHNGLHQCR